MSFAVTWWLFDPYGLWLLGRPRWLASAGDGSFRVPLVIWAALGAKLALPVVACAIVMLGERSRRLVPSPRACRAILVAACGAAGIVTALAAARIAIGGYPLPCQECELPGVLTLPSVSNWRTAESIRRNASGGPESQLERAVTAASAEALCDGWYDPFWIGGQRHVLRLEGDRLTAHRVTEQENPWRYFERHARFESWPSYVRARSERGYVLLGQHAERPEKLAVLVTAVRRTGCVRASATLLDRGLLLDPKNLPLGRYSWIVAAITLGGVFVLVATFRWRPRHRGLEVLQLSASWVLLEAMAFLAAQLEPFV